MPGAKHSYLVLLFTVLLGLGLEPRQGNTHGAVGGASTIYEQVITSTTPQTLVTLPFDLSTFPHLHHCVVTASAEAVNNEAHRDVDNAYIFVLSLDSTTPIANHPSARIIDFDSPTMTQGISRADFVEVSSTFLFKNIRPGPHAIRWMARKFNSTDRSLIVNDVSLTVVCHQNMLE